MINQLCPTCNALAKNIRGSYATCEYCGRSWVINKNKEDEVEVFDEKEYLKIKKELMKLLKD